MAITSDEKQDTIKRAMEMVNLVLPKKAFYGREQGPKVIMTDDSLAEHNALAEVWPEATLHYCFAYFISYSVAGHGSMTVTTKSEIITEQS